MTTKASNPNNPLGGESLEVLCSQIWHPRGLPLLLSSRFLRRRGCGQVDVSLVGGRTQKKIVLIECKASGNLSDAQYRRLAKTAHLTAQLLEMPAVIQIFSGRPSSMI